MDWTRKKCCTTLFMLLLHAHVGPSTEFWDLGSTTVGPRRADSWPRTSFFRWQRTEFESMRFWYPYFDWQDIAYRRMLCVCAGISIDFTPLSTGVILNRRTVITSANPLDPHMSRQRNVRLWVLGRAGRHDTPYRYRVWRVHRVFPKSLNPEHAHGPRGAHCPRHDVAVIISFDQMYIYYIYSTRYQYAYRAVLTSERDQLASDMVMTGSGYEYLEHIYENYKIFYTLLKKHDVVDCSKYLPKWWGKFICIRNVKFLAGIQNGGGLLQNQNQLMAIGCFEIRYNEDRVYVFTDLRYYVRWIYKTARILGGEYYEYAYPEWGQMRGVFNIYDGGSNNPIIPLKQVYWDLFPLG